LNCPPIRGRIEQRDVVARLGRGRRAGESGRPGAHHGNALAPLRRLQHDHRLVTRARVDETGRDLPREDLVEARLIARDAGVDLVRASLRGLDDEFGVGEQRPRHRHDVGIAARQQRLGHGGIVDPISRDERDRHLALHSSRHPGERGTRDHRRDRRNPRLVPADTGVDHRRPGCLDRLGQHNDFIPRCRPRPGRASRAGTR
jgi:hypothetical protein